LTNYKSITKNKDPINKDILNNIHFGWGSNGLILFKENNILMTSWGQGSYNWLDNNTLLLSWSGYDHIIRMNYNFTTFFSIRMKDCDIVYGFIK